MISPVSQSTILRLKDHAGMESIEIFISITLTMDARQMWDDYRWAIPKAANGRIGFMEIHFFTSKLVAKSITITTVSFTNFNM